MEGFETNHRIGQMDDYLISSPQPHVQTKKTGSFKKKKKLTVGVTFYIYIYLLNLKGSNMY